MKPKRKNPINAEPQHVTAERHLRQFSDATGRELGRVLGAVVGELDYALSVENPKTRERAMGVALLATERALGLSRNLRYFSQFTQLHRELTDLSQILIDAVDLVEKEFEAKKIQVHVFAEAATYLRVDAKALSQALLNLLDNAAASMPNGGKITLTLRALEHSTEIRCADTGRGISENDIEDVFEPYLCLDKKEHASTVGLGLAVTKALVEGHGGEVFVQSREGDGTTFTILLPEKAEKEPQISAAKKRNFRRIHTRFPANFRVGEETIHGEVRVLSLGGAYVHFVEEAPTQIPALNQEIEVTLEYFEHQTLVLPRCRIASLNWGGSKKGIGLQFSKLDEKAKRILTGLIQAQTT